MSEDEFINKGNKAYKNSQSPQSSTNDNDKEEKLLKKVADYTNNLKLPSTKTSKNDAWNAIQHKINQPKFEIEKSNFVDRITQSTFLTRVAAVIGVFVGIYTIWFFSNDIVQVSPKDGTLEYTFPDGSVAILKKGSQIQFLKTGFDGHIYLDGHAQFYVNDDGDEDNMFEVKTDRTVVYAKDGSKFDLRDDKHMFQLTNIGQVDIQYHEEHSIEKKQYVLSIGKTLKTFNSILPLPIDKGLKHTKWVDGRFAYKNAPLMMVISDLEKQFGIIVDHKIKPKEIQFTGNFNDDNIESALTSICAKLPIDYVLQGEKVLLKREQQNLESED